MKHKSHIIEISIPALALLIVSVFLYAHPVRAGNACQSNGTGGGPWSSVFTWVDCSGDIPQSGDAVFIQAGDAVDLDENPASGITSITINSGGILSISFSGNMYGIPVTVDGTFKINQNGYVANATFYYGTDGILEFANNLASFTLTGSEVFWPSDNGPSHITVSGGSGGGLDMSGVSRIVNGLFQTNGPVTRNANLTISGLGTLQLNNGGSIGLSPIYGDGATLIYNQGNTVDVSSNEWPVSNGPSNVTISNGTNVLFADSISRTIQGTLLLETSTQLAFTSGQKMTINGAVMVSNGAVLQKGDGNSRIYFHGLSFTNNGSVMVKVYFSGEKNTFAGSGHWSYLYIEMNSNTSPANDNLTLYADEFYVDGSLDLKSYNFTLDNCRMTVASNASVYGTAALYTQGTVYLSIGSPIMFNIPLVINSGTTTAFGNFNDTITVAAPGTLVIDIILTAYNPVTVNGTMTGAGAFDFEGGTFTNNGTVSNTGIFHTLSTTTLNQNGTFSAPLSVDFQNTTTYGPYNGKITVSSGATLQVKAGSDLTANSDVTVLGTLSGGSSSSSLIFKGGMFINYGTVTIDNTTLSSDSAQHIHGSGTWTGAGTLAINNNTILDNELSLSVYTLSVNSSLDLNSYRLTVNRNYGCIVNGNGDISGGEFHTRGVVSIDGMTAFNSPLYVDDGTTIAYGNFGEALAIAGGAVLQVSAGQNLIADRDVTVNGLLSGGDDLALLTFNGGTIANNNSVSVVNITFNGTDAQYIRGTGGWTGTGVLEINSSTTIGNSITFGMAALTVNVVLDLNGFNFTVNRVAGCTVSGAGTITGGEFHTKGSVSVNNVADFATRLVVESGTTTAYGNYGGTIIINSGAILRVSDGQTLMDSSDLVVYGTLSGGNVASRLIFNSVSFTNNGSVTIYNVQFGGFNQILEGTGSFGAYNTATVEDGTTLTLGSDHKMGRVIINAGGLFDISNRSLSLAFVGIPLENNAGVTGFITTGSTIIYNGSTAQTVQATDVVYNNLTIDNPAGATLNGAINIPGILRLTQGTLNINGFLTMGSGASIVRSAGSLSASPIFNNIINLEYTGSSQITTGPELPTTPGVLNNVLINNVAGVTAGGNILLIGNWTNYGNFIANNKTVAFIGSGSQEICGYTKFYNLTIINTAASPGDGSDIRALANITVLNQLSVNDGQFRPYTGSDFKNINVAVDGVLKPASTASIIVNGDFINSGGFIHNNSTMTFRWITPQYLTLNVPTAFYNLKVDNSSTLVETVAANNASVIGALSSCSTCKIRKTLSTDSMGDKVFGLTGVTIHVDSVGNLNTITVDRVDANHPRATNNNLMTGRYWRITRTLSGGINEGLIDITLPYIYAGSGDKTCRWINGSGSGFDCGETSENTYVENTSVTRNNYPTADWFNQGLDWEAWTVGHNVGPTAITLRSFSARSISASTLPIALGLSLLAITVASAGIWGLRRQQVS